jgi:transglutaminase-like putative cysteine protease
MITSTRPPPTAPAAPRPRLPWVTVLAAGTAVLLAGTPVFSVVQGTGWVGYAAAAVGVVGGSGLLLHRFGVSAVAAGQCVAVLLLLIALFTERVLPGPTAIGELGSLITGAGRQIGLETAPVPPTPEILALLTAAFGLLAVAVHLAAVSATAPAAAGVPLLTVFAIPTALADGLLPVPVLAAAAAGYGLLLLTGARPRAMTRRAVLRRLPAAAGLVTVAVVLAVGIGSGAGFVGTAGRFSGSPGSAGAIGLSPFTSLRGQLVDGDPVELLRVRGLGRGAYLRALTLNDYLPGVGFRAARPAPGTPLPGPVQPRPAVPGEVIDVQVENVEFRDYWLPLPGEPLAVAGLPDGQWVYDRGSGTGYTLRPRQDDTWSGQVLLPRPTAAELRATADATGAALEYRGVSGLDPRVTALAERVVAGRQNAFDRAMALQDFFTGPGSEFRYSLQTAPGRGDDALVEFLTVGRAGYCEQFASAMAVMLRAVGIPSRVAVGFTAGTDLGDYRSIRTSDAHAWVEAYFPGTGWVGFDPTPLSDGRAIAPEYVLQAREEAARAAAPVTQGDLGPGRVEQDEPAPAPDPAAAAPDPAAPAPDDGAGGPAWPTVGALLVGAVLVGGVLAPAALRRRQRDRRLAAVAAGGPAAADAGWRELLAESADRGVPSPPSDTVRGAARRMVREHRLDGPAQEALRTVIGAVEASWYGGRHPGVDELSGPVRTVQAGLTTGTPLPLRARLLPRSVLAPPSRTTPTTTDDVDDDDEGRRTAATRG